MKTKDGLPKLDEALPGKQSLKKRLRANIINEDFVNTFGPVGTTAGAYGLTKADKPTGEGARKDEWNDDPGVR